MLIQIFGKNGIGFSRRLLKQLGIFNFDLSKVSTAFTFLLEKMLISEIGVFLLPKMLMTDKKNTHYCKCNTFFCSVQNLKLKFNKYLSLSYFPDLFLFSTFIEIKIKYQMF